jgi:hypothetical protein
VLLLTKLENSFFYKYKYIINYQFPIRCYGTNSGASSDGRHLAPGRPTGPWDETLSSIVLMNAHDEQV